MAIQIVKWWLLTQTILTDSGFLNTNWKNTNKKELYNYLQKWETSQLTTRKLKFARDRKTKLVLMALSLNLLWTTEERKTRLS